ncbi:MAG: hypothetical protein ACYS8Z_27340 [Planctomycetota bacterium]
MEMERIIPRYRRRRFCRGTYIEKALVIKPEKLQKPIETHLILFKEQT